MRGFLDRFDLDLILNVAAGTIFAGVATALVDWIAWFADELISLMIR